MKTIAEINERIKQGKAVVLTAEEMTKAVKEMGPEKAAKEIDVVTTGTFSHVFLRYAFQYRANRSPNFTCKQNVAQ